MTEVELFVYGWINPALAYAMSTSGCLLAIVLSTKARGRAGRGRGRLLVYATVSLGGIGIFQSQFLALLGLGVPGSVLRYDPLSLVESLGAGAVGVGAGLMLVGFGRPGPFRLAAASGFIGAGAAAAHYLAVDSVRAAGYLYYEPYRLAASAVTGTLAAGVIVWFSLSPRGIRSTVLAAPVAGAGLCGVHYLAASALRAEPGLLLAVDGSRPTTGFSPMVLMGPAVLLGAAIAAMLWFFTVGASTVEDLRAIFVDPENSVEIEPWMIEEVTRRVSVERRPSRPMLAGNNAAGSTTRPVEAGRGTTYPAPAVNARTTPGPVPAVRAVAATAVEQRPGPPPVAMPGWSGQAPIVSSAANSGPARSPAQPDRYPPGYNRTRRNTQPPA